MLTVAAEQTGADLVVWPEAAYPYMMSATAKNDLAGRYAVLQPGVHGPVLDGRHHAANATWRVQLARLLVDARGTSTPAYHKMHLLAFGEGVPLAGTFPVVAARSFVRGIGHGLQAIIRSRSTSKNARVAVLNCFEDTLPQAAARSGDVDPNLLVNVTNDAWFVETEESELHIRIASMRAIELRRDFVRAVNFGVTTWVDATGRVRARYDVAVAGTLQTTPALLEGKTIYARLGDWAGVLLLALFSAATFAGTGAATKRKRRVPTREDTPSSV